MDITQSIKVSDSIFKNIKTDIFRDSVHFLEYNNEIVFKKSLMV